MYVNGDTDALILCLKDLHGESYSGVIRLGVELLASDLGIDREKVLGSVADNDLGCEGVSGGRLCSDCEDI